MTAPALTYWRCRAPLCGTAIVWWWRGAPVTVGREPTRRDLERAEAPVEAHEARHGIGAA